MTANDSDSDTYLSPAVTSCHQLSPAVTSCHQLSLLLSLLLSLQTSLLLS